MYVALIFEVYTITASTINPQEKPDDQSRRQAAGRQAVGIARGMGVLSQRFSMLVEDGVVKQFNLEPSGQFDISSAEKMLAQV